MQNEEYPFDENLKEVEESSSNEDDQNELPPKDIVAYNELRSCADIKRMKEQSQLRVDPDFQREFVWRRADQTRFIDSLIKQLPIPSMCISYDYNSEERLVIDGRQRISTIIDFLTNDDYRLSRLEDVDPKISGKSVKEIRAKDSAVYGRVENLVIPITVIRCDTSKANHMDYLFTIFHRLNSGGSKLNNQEIRNCIYSGAFNSLLKKSVKNTTYLNLMGITDAAGYRFAYEEQNLRFFAFYENLANYSGKLAKFLSDFMFEKEKGKRPATPEDIEALDNLFTSVVETTKHKVLGKSTLHGVSKAIIDAVLVGVAHNLAYISNLTPAQGAHLYKKLRADDLFSIDSLKENIAQKSRVVNRLERAIQIFSGR
jgi:hypothetical protein